MALLDYQPPTSPYLDILYKDDDIVVLNKPSGLLSVPGKHREHFDSLMLRVQAVWPTSGVVHRLDMMTSGIIVMAMHKDALRHLNRQFSERDTDKFYIAVVSGHIEQDRGSVDLPLICDWPNRPKQMVCHENGKPSLTHFEVMGRGETQENKWTRVKLTPITGRSHQLRVHMQQLGHPILGDRLYAPDEVIAQSPRLLLHAQRLSIKHPKTEAQMTFEKPCDF
ncbi:MAG: bifunctional tRNA pseudouridine(32) synthase/23S rRNA pseudouridine(746) synthase RluA [Gammaproteobacteria bacterium]|nr:bifunctional tRNA pseudouridine(32) synthase/23S rRNA pseudouridine(746) synthase RluA [Gammaproteobacteria bacterium]